MKEALQSEKTSREENCSERPMALTLILAQRHKSNSPGDNSGFTINISKTEVIASSTVCRIQNHNERAEITGSGPLQLP